jgi:hypothetical protein
MKPPDNVTPMRPPLRLARVRESAAHTAPVQTPVMDYTPLPSALHPDQRVANALHAAWWSGHDTAEKNQYTKGWRAGLRTGLLWGLVLGVPAGVAAAQAGVWLSTWWGL